MNHAFFDICFESKTAWPHKSPTGVVALHGLIGKFVRGRALDLLRIGINYCRTPPSTFFNLKLKLRLAARPDSTMTR